MSNFNTLTEVAESKDDAFFLTRQDGVDVKVKKQTLFQGVAESDEIKKDIFNSSGNIYIKDWKSGDNIPAKVDRVEGYALWDSKDGRIILPINESAFTTNATIDEDLNAGNFAIVGLAKQYNFESYLNLVGSKYLYPSYEIKTSYHTVEGVGGCSYYVDGSDTTSDHDGVYVIVNASNQRIKRIDSKNISLSSAGLLGDKDKTYNQPLMQAICKSGKSGVVIDFDVACDFGHITWEMTQSKTTGMSACSGSF